MLHTILVSDISLKNINVNCKTLDKFQYSTTLMAALGVWSVSPFRVTYFGDDRLILTSVPKRSKCPKKIDNQYMRRRDGERKTHNHQPNCLLANSLIIDVHGFSA